MIDRSVLAPRRLDERVAVLGVGVEGLATVHYLLGLGYRQIVALDRQPIEGLPAEVESVTGPEYLKGLEHASLVYRSPGIRPDLAALEAVRRRGGVVTSAIGEFLTHCPARVVGVTGTLGKGTAATLLARMLEASGWKAHLAGNIGTSPLGLVGALTETDIVVLEISSFQAMDLERSPEVCVVLKTTSEHLDWHKDLDEYRSAKAGLVRHQRPTDALIYCADAPGSLEIAARSKAGRRFAYSVQEAVTDGAAVLGGRAIRFVAGAAEPLPIELEHLRLAGRFNQENILAALLGALACGAALAPCLEAAVSFEGLPHRLEFVAQTKTVRFFNDSYATRPDATIGALGCFEGEPLALILGGSEKHADFTELAQRVARRPGLVHVALIGQTAPRLEAAIVAASSGAPRFVLSTYEGLEAAMTACTAALPRTGGVVLMSPACASFGLFPNYKVRGETFRALAKTLVAAAS